MKNPFILRLYILLFLVFLFGGIMIAKLFYIQVVNTEYYQNLANKQYVSNYFPKFERGNIYFTEKNNNFVSAAVMQDNNPRGDYPATWRYYPGESLASHILGFVGYKGDDLVGRYGVEEFYDEILKRDENNENINSFAKVFLDLSREIIAGEKNSADSHLCG